MMDSSGPEHPDYAGMTTNERLFVAGTLERFDDAVKKADRETMVKLLVNVQISGEEARQITETILSDPKRFGY